MKLNEYARAVHENAVAHGWYDNGIEFPEVAALIHSEISEALAEYREGNPLIYECCGIPGAVYASSRGRATSRKTSALASRRASPWSFATLS